MARRRKTRRRGGLWAGAVALTLAAAAAVVVSVAVGTGAWRIAPIRTGAMRPGLPVGGVVVAERVPVSSLAVRDVVLLHPPGDPGATDARRIVSLSRTASATSLQTQADATTRVDPWTLRVDGRSIYEARFSLPLLGYVAVGLGSGPGRIVLIAVGALVVALLVTSLALNALHRRSRRHARPRGRVWALPAGPAPATALPAAMAAPADEPVDEHVGLA